MKILDEETGRGSTRTGQAPQPRIPGTYAGIFPEKTPGLRAALVNDIWEQGDSSSLVRCLATNLNSSE